MNVLDPKPSNFAAADIRYKRGDLVPPSVTHGTTRNLEIDREGQTMPLKANKSD